MQLRIVALAAASLAFAGVALADLVLPRVSPNATVKQTIGVTDLSLTYSRPGVKGRAIWGALVPYDQLWRTGANDATSFTCSDDITVSGQKLPAGTYALFTIPNPARWTVVFNRQKGLLGTVGYDSTQDAIRVGAVPDTGQAHQEWMALGFENLAATGCDLVLSWQRLRLAVPITVEVNEHVLANCRREIAAAKPDDWRTPMNAARWCFDNDVALAEGRGWLDRSIAVQGGYANLTLKARWQLKDGKKKEAIATAKQAIAAGKASKEKVDTAPTEKLLAEWTAK